jgi:hypothetical protein
MFILLFWLMLGFAQPEWMCALVTAAQPVTSVVFSSSSPVFGSWNPQLVVPVQNITQVVFVPELDAWFLLGSNVILSRSLDGGNVWTTPVLTPTGMIVSAGMAYSTSRNVLLLVGSGAGAIYQSTDGGANFVVNSAASSLPITAYAAGYAVSTDTFVVVGALSTSPRAIFQIGVSGTWTVANIPATTAQEARSVAFSELLGRWGVCMLICWQWRVRVFFLVDWG